MDRADRSGSGDECFEFFEREVQNYFSLLDVLGYEGPLFTRGHEDPLGEVMDATYSSSTRKILIRLAKPSKNTRHAMIVFISRLPREGVRDNLEITLFAKKYRPELAEAIDRFQNESPTTEEFIRSVFPIYSSLLKEEAREIIAGQRWEVGFYSDWT
jgi:hypothetical protein